MLARHLREAWRRFSGLEHRHLVYPDTLSPAVASTLPVDTLGSPFDASPTDRDAVTLVAVYRCWSLIVDQAAPLPFEAYSADDRRLEIQPAVMTRPDPFARQIDSMSQILVSLVARGNAYLRLAGHDAAGNPSIALPIHPDEMQVTWNRQRTRAEYRWRNQPLTLGRDLSHIALWRLPGELVGQSPLDAARRVINGHRQSDEYARRLFSDGAIPSGTLESEQLIDPDDVTRLQSQWAETHTGRRMPAVLGQGLHFNAISLRPDEAQFLESRRFSTGETARLYGIPGAMIDAPPEAGASVIYQSIPMLATAFTRFALQPYLERIERAFDELLPAGVSARFDTTRLLRTDADTRFSAYATALGGQPFMTVPEVRELEGLPVDETLTQAPAASEGVPA